MRILAGQVRILEIHVVFGVGKSNLAFSLLSAFSLSRNLDVTLMTHDLFTAQRSRAFLENRTDGGYGRRFDVTYDPVHFVVSVEIAYNMYWYMWNAGTTTLHSKKAHAFITMNIWRGRRQSKTPPTTQYRIDQKIVSPVYKY
jgi:hypothetical protein